ncbi:MAG: DUF4860 domain-containing protein [Oscillospiraceae bacterium]|nr:DUF4860 domain-containing protein [Oscillospiraceae bacterium]
MKQSQTPSLGLYTIGIAALFLAGFFLLVVFGAGSYRNTVTGQEENMRDRALLGYLSTAVKAYDTAGAVIVEDTAAGRTLVLLDGDSGYALRVYLHAGKLIEDYAPASSELNPDGAQVIGATESFSVEERAPGLLSLRTDEGQVLLHLRSEVRDA